MTESTKKSPPLSSSKDLGIEEKQPLDEVPQIVSEKIRALIEATDRFLPEDGTNWAHFLSLLGE
ncbi:hypothetical protein ACFL21_04770 [Patescibacteria group bacterium]